MAVLTYFIINSASFPYWLLNSRERRVKALHFYPSNVIFLLNATL